MSDVTRRESQDGWFGAGVTRREDDGAPGGGATRREDGQAPGGGSTRREGEFVGAAATLAASLGQFGLLAQVPELAERFVLDREATAALGPEGGQAQLAVVRDADSGHQVVLKVYSRGTQLDAVAMGKLIELGRDPVGSRHVLPILETGADAHSGLTWELQEYLPAGSLEDVFLQGVVSKEFAAALVREVCTALSFVHTVGVTHADLKPGNILVRSLDPLNVVVADFGLAIQQDLSVVVKSVAGSWPYLPPESRANEFSPAMDWWALGLVVARGLTGRHMFQEPGGERMLSDATIANQLAHRSYTLPVVGDARWDLLIAGLLTADPRHRWGPAQVKGWLGGGTPSVHAEPPHASGVGLMPRVQPFAFAGTDYATPVELAAAFRTRWQEAGNLLVGRGREDLLTWLRRTPIGTGADAVLDRSDLHNPEAPLVRLQVILDPETVPAFRGRNLSTEGLNAALRAAREGDTSAISWITGLRDERILSAWAGEAEVPTTVRHADGVLFGWWYNLDGLLSRIPAEQAQVARPALEPVLLEAALDPTARERLLTAGRKVAASSRSVPEWATLIRTAATRNDAGPEHAALALALLPAAEKTETARREGVKESERRAERERKEERRRGRGRAKRGQIGSLLGLGFFAMWPTLVYSGVATFFLSGGTDPIPNNLSSETIFTTIMLAHLYAVLATVVIVAIAAPGDGPEGGVAPAMAGGVACAAMDVVVLMVGIWDRRPDSTSFPGIDDPSLLYWGPITLVLVAAAFSVVSRLRSA